MYDPIDQKSTVSGILYGINEDVIIIQAFYGNLLWKKVEEEFWVHEIDLCLIVLLQNWDTIVWWCSWLAVFHSNGHTSPSSRSTAGTFLLAGSESQTARLVEYCVEKMV